MNKELASVLKTRIQNLPFIDKLAGLVQIVEEQSFVDGDAKNTPVLKKFPASYDTVGFGADCAGQIKDLIPNSAYKSITYFEDFGSTMPAVGDQVIKFNSKLRLICWLNRSLLTGDQYSQISAPCIAALITALTGRKFDNIGIFTQLNVKAVQIQPQTKALFSNYTYDQTVRQYLMPPFEFFGIDLLCIYNVSAKCINEINFNNQAICQ